MRCLFYQLNTQLAPLIYEIQRDRLRYLKDIEERIRWYFDELNFIKGNLAFSIYHE